MLEAGVSGEHDPAVLTPGPMGLAHGLVVRLELRDRAGGGTRRTAHRGSARQGPRRFERHQRDGAHPRQPLVLRPLACAWAIRAGATTSSQPFFDARSSSTRSSRATIRTRVTSRFCVRPTELGFRADPRHDFNGPKPQGVAGFLPKNVLNGRRHSAAAAFLAPALSARTSRSAHRRAPRALVLEGRRVVGVEYLRDGRRERVRAQREVVVCAGAIDSPKLLMLSGIGAAAICGRTASRSSADLPGVGAQSAGPSEVVRPLEGQDHAAGFHGGRGSVHVVIVATPMAICSSIVGRGLDQPDDFITITVSHLKPRSRGAVTLAIRRSAGGAA